MNNDDFLYSLRETPRQEFERSLYRRLIEGEARQRRNRLIISSTIAVLMLLFGTLTIPSVRAAVIDTLETIAGIKFLETSEYPSGDDIDTIPYDTMSVDLARSEFDLNLPEWAPEGYTIESDVLVADMEGFRHVIITWNKPGEPGIQLEVLLQENTIVVGPESVETIEIGERSVAVWHGGWNFDEEKWDESINVITLSWSDDGKIGYHLMGYPADGLDEETCIEYLIKMVESIP